MKSKSKRTRKEEKMRYQLTFELNNEKFPLDYRRTIMSYIKNALSQHDKDTYQKYYHDKDPIVKPFTFSVYFNSPIFEKETIIIKDHTIKLNLSIQDYSLAIILYNSINHQRNIPFPIANNNMTLKNITMIPEDEIATNQITIKFMSPLVVRERKAQKDWYYFYSEESKFQEVLKQNLKEQLSISKIPLETIENFEIRAIQPKKTIIQFYEKKIEASVGTYVLKGDKDLLKFLYQCGMRKQALSRIRNVFNYQVKEVPNEKKNILK